MINSRYKIIRKIGEGRCKVFLVSDMENSDEIFALKLLKSPFSEKERKIFREEFLLLEKINYPNIIKVYNFETVLEIDEDDSKFKITLGSKFFVMEYFDGENLFEFTEIVNEGILLILISQICHTLYYLHQSNYIYSDIKPENILVKLVDDSPQIKFIDFGFTKRIHSDFDEEIQGSVEYLAPEILRKEKFDYRADLYSLGITLYKILYRKFPFKTKSEVGIIRAHLEEKFKYPGNVNSQTFIPLLKKLLSKKPHDRFRNTLEILGYLNLGIDNLVKNYFLPIVYFSGRDEIIFKVHRFISSEELNKIILIKGSDGTGKTAIAKYLSNNKENVFYLNLEFAENIIYFWKKHLRNFILNLDVAQLETDLLNELMEFTLPNTSVELEQLKQILIKLSRHLNFTLIIDDFNKLDELNLEFLRQILLVFLTNNVKIILFENSNFPTACLFSIEIEEINLKSFDESELFLYIKNNFTKFFPTLKFMELLSQSSDFNPGSILNFLKESIEFEVLDFDSSGPKLNLESTKINLLKGSQEEIIQLKMKELDETETNVVETLSLFNLNIDTPTLISLLDIEANYIQHLIEKLVYRNFITISKTGNQISFASQIIKQFIYNRIADKEKTHLSISEKIIQQLPYFKKSELAKQLELGKNFIRAYEIYLDEIADAEKLSAFSYIKSLLEHILTMPLDVNKNFNVKIKLSKILKVLGNNIQSLELTNDLLTKCESNETRNELIIQKGQCLISLGELSEGVNQLNYILSELKDESKLNVILEIAGAYIDLSKFKEANDLCLEVINHKFGSKEEKAKAFNLLALIDIYEKHNFDSAISYFNMARSNYEELNNINRTAIMEVNLGNIYNMKGEPEVALDYWNRSLQKNLSIGNLEQEANLLLNFGIYHFNKLNFELALENYKRASNIFISSGNKYGQGLAYLNIGESYLFICEYQKAHDSINKALNIFIELQNYTEEAETLLLLGELYRRVNCVNKLESICNRMSRLILSRPSLDKYNMNLVYMEQYLDMLKGNLGNVEEKLFVVLNKYLDDDDRQNYIKVLFTLCEFLIGEGKIDIPIRLLNEKELLVDCANNKLNKSQREYYLGRISIINQGIGLNVPIDYFENAYHLLENESISELLCCVMFEISRYYFGRGNFKRSEDYIYYCEDLIYFIADKIIDSEIKGCYLLAPERKQMLEKLKLMESEII